MKSPQPNDCCTDMSDVYTGDATEDMVNSLDSGKDEDQDHEEVYKMANVMSECEGLTVMLQR